MFDPFSQGKSSANGLTKNDNVESEIAPSKNALDCSRVHLWTTFISSRRLLIKIDSQLNKP